MARPFLLAVMGPTGCGKSALAEALAQRTGAQLISADAFQVYRGFDVGTNKPTRPEIYRLIDIKDPTESYGVGEFVLDAAAILSDTFERGQPAIVVGGTGLYIRALFEEYQDLLPAPDPHLRAIVGRLPLEDCLEELDRAQVEVDRQNPVRVRRAVERLRSNGEPIAFQLPPYKRIKLALWHPTEVLDAAIAERTATLLQNGWIEEVLRLKDQGIDSASPAFRAIGYADVSRYCDDALTYVDLLREVILQTRQYAKRQRVWLRSEPKLRLLPREAVASPSDDELEEILDQIKDIN